MTHNSSLLLIQVIVLVVAILYLVAWIMTMIIVTRAAREKGYNNLTGKLWFIGLFAMVFTPAIIVAALPDKKLQAKVEQKPIETEAVSIPNQLPTV